MRKRRGDWKDCDRRTVPTTIRRAVEIPPPTTGALRVARALSVVLVCCRGFIDRPASLLSIERRRENDEIQTSAKFKFIFPLAFSYYVYYKN